MEFNKSGYYWLDTWILANVIQLATQDYIGVTLTHHQAAKYDQWQSTE